MRLGRLRCKYAARLPQAASGGQNEKQARWKCLSEAIAMRILLVPVALIMLAGVTLAAPMCTDSASLAAYITNYTGFANACAIGDKLFYDFTYRPSSTPPGIAPGSNQIIVYTLPGDGITNPGVGFSSGGFTVGTGQTIDATIIYSVATFYGTPVLDDLTLSITGSATGSGSGGVTESVTNPEGIPPLITSVGAGGNVLTRHVVFADLLKPNVSGTTVTTDIHVTQPGSGSVTISAIEEYFSENVPEPYQGLLIGCGLLLMGLTRKRMPHR